MKHHCDFCCGVQNGVKYACPVCGRTLIHSLPSREDIYAQAAEHRKRWPLVKLRQQEGWQELEITRASRFHDGMRRREKEDGRET